MTTITVWLLVTFYNGVHYAPYPFESKEHCEEARKNLDAYSGKCVKMNVMQAPIKKN